MNALSVANGSKQSTLKNHSLTHSGERPYPCEEPGCDKGFTMACNMERHMRRFHPSESAFQTDTTDYGDRDTQTEWTAQSSRRGESSREGSSRGGSRRNDLRSSSSRHARKS
ncbi:hypothetical protein JB92DRAFT_3073525 [Gautieria morchelliformis]|nr:hypothetical protein JB92DRAFT_3073525 [Gautieria morchelliformis]